MKDQMALSTQQSNDDDQYVLLAKLDNVRNVSTILKAIHFKKIATLFASPMGLKVTVEDAKCVQANAFIQESIFHHYIIKEEQVTFKINLTVLLECLTIFGSSAVPGVSTSLKMCYAGYGCPLLLILEEDGVLTDCSIKTLEPDEVLDFNFLSTNVINKIIMKWYQFAVFSHLGAFGTNLHGSRWHCYNCYLNKDISDIVHVQDINQLGLEPSIQVNISECLKEAFSELDMTSDVLQILLSPDPPYFRLSTFGNSGSTHVQIEAWVVNKYNWQQAVNSLFELTDRASKTKSDFPKDSDMVESFQCTQTQTNRYKISLLKPSVKALALSARVSIRIDNRGFLSLQYMIKNEDGQVCFVEYYCSPDEDVNEAEH